MVRGWSHCSVHKLAEQHRSKEQLRHMQRFSRPCPPPPEQQPTAAPAAAYGCSSSSVSAAALQLCAITTTAAVAPLLRQWWRPAAPPRRGAATAAGALLRRHGQHIRVPLKSACPVMAPAAAGRQGCAAQLSEAWPAGRRARRAGRSGPR